MIVTVTILQLYEIVVIDTCAYRSRSAEVHRSSFNRSDLACSHEGTVYRSIIVSINCQQMRLITGCVSVKIEVRVVSHIHNGRLVSFRFVTDIDRIIVCQLHQHFTSDISRETFFAIFCRVSQFQFLRIRLNGIKHTVLESLRTAMQAVTVIILRQLILSTVQSKSTLVDTVSITADACSEVRRLADIILNRIEAEHYITHLSVLVGYHH